MQKSGLIFLWLLLLTSSLRVSGQDPAGDLWKRLNRYLNQEFPGHQWDSEQAYIGRLQDGIPFLFWMAVQGSNVSAVYQFDLQEAYFSVEGDLVGDKLTMAEWDENHQPSGQWQLKRNEGGWEGSWYNVNRDRELLIRLSPTSQTTDWTTVVPDSWIRSYQGQFNAVDYDLILTKDLWRIQGIFQNLQTKQIYFLNGNCDGEKAGKFVVEVTDDRNVKQAEATLQINQPTLMQVAWRPQNSQVTYFELALRRELPVQVDLTADETSLYNLSFPDVTEFNLRKQIMRFIGDVRDEFSRLEREVGDPSDRWKHTLHVWPEVSWYNGRFFSGSLIAKSDQGQYELLAINYDFEKAETVEIASLFKKKYDYQNAITQYLQPKIQMLDWPFELEYMRPKLEDFQYINLTKRGFRISTGFNALYGQKSFIIPYSYFEGNLDNNTIIDYILKYQ